MRIMTIAALATAALGASSLVSVPAQAQGPLSPPFGSHAAQTVKAEPLAAYAQYRGGWGRGGRYVHRGYGGYGGRYYGGRSYYGGPFFYGRGYGRGAAGGA